MGDRIGWDGIGWEMGSDGMGDRIGWDGRWDGR